MFQNIARLAATHLKRRYNVEVINAHLLPKKGKAIYAFNHPSRSDGFLAWMFIPGRPIRFLSKHETMNMMWPSMRISKQIPVWRGQGRSHETIALAIKALRKNKIVGIFPEGSSGNAVKHPGIRKFKTGVARLAILSKAPVYPIAIIGSFYDNEKTYELPKVTKIKYVIGKPIIFKNLPKDDSNKKKNQEIANIVQREVQKLLIKYNAPKSYINK